jgi:hypothetical protein
MPPNFRWVSGSSLVKPYEAPVRRTPPDSRARDFLSLARARGLKNPFNLNLLRGGDQRRQGHLAERNSDFWSFLRGSLG